MDASENQVRIPKHRLAGATDPDQSMRSSKMAGSRLPAPPSHSAGLTEWSDSQHNSRLQAPQPVSKGVKREVQPPGKHPYQTEEGIDD